MGVKIRGLNAGVLSPVDFAKSIDRGGTGYIPEENEKNPAQTRMHEISTYPGDQAIENALGGEITNATKKKAKENEKGLYEQGGVFDTINKQVNQTIGENVVNGKVNVPAPTPVTPQPKQPSAISQLADQFRVDNEKARKEYENRRLSDNLTRLGFALGQLHGVHKGGLYSPTESHASQLEKDYREILANNERAYKLALANINNDTKNDLAERKFELDEQRIKANIEAQASKMDLAEIDAEYKKARIALTEAQTAVANARSETEKTKANNQLKESQARVKAWEALANQRNSSTKNQADRVEIARNTSESTINKNDALAAKYKDEVEHPEKYRSNKSNSNSIISAVNGGTTEQKREITPRPGVKAASTNTSTRTARPGIKKK